MSAAMMVFGGWAALIVFGLACSTWRWWRELAASKPDLAVRYRELWAIKNDDIREGRR